MGLHREDGVAVKKALGLADDRARLEPSDVDALAGVQILVHGALVLARDVELPILRLKLLYYLLFGLEKVHLYFLHEFQNHVVTALGGLYVSNPRALLDGLAVEEYSHAEFHGWSYFFKENLELYLSFQAWSSFEHVMPHTLLEIEWQP